MGRRLAAFWPLALLLLLSGCAPHSAGFAPVERALAAGEIQKALKQHEARRFAKRDELIDRLDAALLERMGGNFKESNRHLERAKALIEHYSAVSVSEQAGTFVINDATTAYAGEEFEQVLVHLYSALNHLELGDLYAARVEALQVDLRLEEMAQRGFRGRYSGDPLARYLSGVIFEALNEPSDALIAYRRAYGLFLEYERHFNLSPPHRLGVDLLRATERMGLEQEQARYREAFGIDSVKRGGQTDLVVVASVGLSPLKRESSTLVQRADGRMIRVSLPYYQSRPALIESVRVVIEGEKSVRGELFLPVEAIAKDTLSAKMPAITARAIARTVTKHQVVREADEHGGPLAGFVANVVGVLTESADTRSWFTLPAAIHLARTELPEGTYHITIEGLSPGGGVLVSRHYHAVEVGQEPRFLTPHLIPPYARN